MASAAVNATQQIGGSIGTAVFTAVYAAVLTGASGPQGPDPTALVEGYAWVFRAAAIGLVAAAPVAWFMIRVDRRRFTAVEPAPHLG